MEYKDYYNILGVGRSAGEKEIKRAYRKLARQYHPDKNPDDKASEERFKEINEAYEVLGSPENRAKYDQLGRSYHRYQHMGGAPSGFDFSQWAAAGGPGGSYQSVNIDFEDLLGGAGGFSEFFNTIFRGGSRSRGGSVDGMFGRQASQKGMDIEHNVSITLEEAYHGTTRALATENGEQFTAKIPPGAKTGTKVRLSGKGGPGQAGPGDLFLVISVESDNTFTREGNNLKTSVPVDVLTAVLGGKATVPTLTGPVKLNIPAGTQGGQTFRLKDKGMPYLRDRDRFGDLLATVRITVPEELSDEERQHYNELEKLAGDRS